MSTFVAAPPSPVLSPTLEPQGLGWFGQLFNVKPAVRPSLILFTKDPPLISSLQAYVFHSCDNCVATRLECANLLKSFGVSVELDSSDGYGVLKCHVDYIQGSFFDLYDIASVDGDFLCPFRALWKDDCKQACHVSSTDFTPGYRVVFECSTHAQPASPAHGITYNVYAIPYPGEGSQIDLGSCRPEIAPRVEVRFPSTRDF